MKTITVPPPVPKFLKPVAERKFAPPPLNDGVTIAPLGDGRCRMFLKDGTGAGIAARPEIFTPARRMLAEVRS